MKKSKLSQVSTNGHKPTRLTNSMLSGLDSKIRARDALLLQTNDAIVAVNKDIEIFLNQCARELGLDVASKAYGFDPQTRMFRELKREQPSEPQGLV